MSPGFWTPVSPTPTIVLVISKPQLSVMVLPSTLLTAYGGHFADFLLRGSRTLSVKTRGASLWFGFDSWKHWIYSHIWDMNIHIRPEKKGRTTCSKIKWFKGFMPFSEILPKHLIHRISKNNKRITEVITSEYLQISSDYM